LSIAFNFLFGWVRPQSHLQFIGTSCRRLLRLSLMGKWDHNKLKSYLKK